MAGLLRDVFHRGIRGVLSRAETKLAIILLLLWRCKSGNNEEILRFTAIPDQNTVC